MAGASIKGSWATARGGRNGKVMISITLVRRVTNSSNDSRHRDYRRQVKLAGVPRTGDTVVIETPHGQSLEVIGVYYLTVPAIVEVHLKKDHSNFTKRTPEDFEETCKEYEALGWECEPPKTRRKKSENKKSNGTS